MEKAKKQVREAVNASIPAIVPSVVIPGKAKVGEAAQAAFLRRRASKTQARKTN